jgi:L-iditol 2-dehydrogenase
MQALVKYRSGPGHVELREVSEPPYSAAQVRIEVGYCGICGTDLHVERDTFRNFPPVILGHECSGTIVETGDRVRGFHGGDHVTVLGATAVTCSRCVYCRRGEFMFCPDRRGMGHGVDGAFTRFVVAREDQLFRLPGGLPLDEGSLVEPFTAAVHAVCEVAEPRLGAVALVSGPGPIGLMAVKLLAAQGIKTIVAGATTDYLRLEAAGRFGAAVTVDVGREDLETVVREETDGFGVDLALECAGVAASAASAMAVVRPLGRYVQVGHFGHDVTLPLDRVAFRQLQVAGSVGYTANTWVRALGLLGSGTVRLGDLITHRLPLADWRLGFDLCQQKDALKVVLSPAARAQEACREAG